MMMNDSRASSSFTSPRADPPPTCPPVSMVHQQRQQQFRPAPPPPPPPMPFGFTMRFGTQLPPKQAQHPIQRAERCSRVCLSCFRAKKKCGSSRPCERCLKMDIPCEERPSEMSADVKYQGKCTHCEKFLRKNDSNVHR